MSCTGVKEILKLCEEFIPGDPPEYFFDKNPENFASVLEMYRSEKFHIPDGGRGKIFTGLFTGVEMQIGNTLYTLYKKRIIL